MREPVSRFHWPKDGTAIRVPPRRLAGGDAICEVIPFVGSQAQAQRRCPWDRIGDAVPRGTRVVLLVAAEDVSFNTADVPALSGMRLREALPNLVEEKTVGEAAGLHVALGRAAGEGPARTLAVVDRAWLATIQAHVARAGLRTGAVVPESLAIPLVPDTWALGIVGTGAARRAWLRYGAQAAMPLPAEADSAAAVARMLARPGAKPTQIHGFCSDDAASVATGIAEALGVPAVAHASDPFAAWIAGDGPAGGYGPPLSLFAFESAGAGVGVTRWRIAALLVVAIVAVQVIGMQWEWAGLRREARALRDESTTLLTGAFPETKVIADPPLQMARGLAGLRASAGHSDPADFSSMIAASARIFASLPTNAVRGADYESRALRLRFAPGSATAGDERDRFIAAAAQEGYALRFDASANTAGEAQASLRVRGAAS
jgi:general secretion pathway protein L